MTKVLKLVEMEDRTTISVSKDVRKEITRLANKADISIYTFTNTALAYAIKRRRFLFEKKGKNK